MIGTGVEPGRNSWITYRELHAKQNHCVKPDSDLSEPDGTDIPLIPHAYVNVDIRLSTTCIFSSPRLINSPRKHMFSAPPPESYRKADTTIRKFWIGLYMHKWIYLYTLEWRWTRIKFVSRYQILIDTVDREFWEIAFKTNLAISQTQINCVLLTLWNNALDENFAM